MRSFPIAVLALLAGAGGVRAQNEAALRAAFEGRYVTVKIDMPATSQGVDVYPLEQTPVDFREVANRLKENGTAIRPGQRVLVTKVVIKGTSHIEFQLGGGGYGTFGDWMSNSSSSTAVHAGETAQERALRDEIKRTTDKERKKQLERELDGLRSARERENARAEAEAAQANEAREANLRNRRADSGSRFNVRFRHGMPGDALTPEGLARALSAYIEFDDAVVTTAVPGQAPVSVQQADSSRRAPPGGLAALRKGLTLAEVEALLGPAMTATEAQEGSITVLKRTYASEGMKVATRFVSGVLIDFAITPQ